MLELSITVKGEDSTLTKKFLEYDSDIYFSHDSKELQELVAQVHSEYKGNIDVTVIKGKMLW